MTNTNEQVRYKYTRSSEEEVLDEEIKEDFIAFLGMRQKNSSEFGEQGKQPP
jgi:hypothetical protein